MQHHACLGQGEGHEHPDHVERNQCVGVAAKGDEQHGSERAETKNAVRERQPVALVHELTRKIAIAGQNRRQPRKSAYAVFAASTRMSIVAACTGSTEAASLEDAPRELGDHGLLLARDDPYACARSVMPTNIVIASTAMMTIVAAAFFASAA
jgi:hypothetical protein